MLIKKWSFLIRCLQGHGTKNEAISHFGNRAGVVMKLEHGGKGRRKGSLLFSFTRGKSISKKKVKKKVNIALDVDIHILAWHFLQAKLAVCD